MALYALLGLLTFVVLGGFGGVQYAKSWWFQDRPNTLTIEGELHTVPFQWTASRHDGHTEPHAAILIPVKLPNLPKTLYMQFDTGSPYTFVRSGALESLQRRGVEHEVFQEDDQTRVRRFELNVGGNRVVLNSGHVMQRKASIDWDNPDSINILGSFGTDLLDQKVCAIDFPARELRLYRSRPKSLASLGEFAPFGFRGRRIMLPAVIDGTEQDLFYDSGCSAFGLLTSKYHYKRFTDPNVKEIQYSANRFGDAVPVHHKPSDMQMQFGAVELPLVRVSYVELYGALQATFGRFSFFGGFLGNKALIASTLILDTVAHEFLVVRQEHVRQDQQSGKQPASGPEVTRWIQSTAVPLQPEQKSYGRIEQKLAAATIVGLGEATHGQHEAFDLKRRVTMHLIRNHGFRVVAYEASSSRATACDDYIAGRTNESKKAVSGLGMLIWQVEENRQLLDDLRAWNQTAKPEDRVRFVGCDAQSGGAIIKLIAALLGDKDARNGDQTASAQLKALLDRSAPATKKAHGGDRSELDTLLAEAAKAADAIRKLARDQSLDVSAIDLRLREFVLHLGLYGKMGARDEAMAELLLAQLGPAGSRKKCVVWGHNAHIQRSPLTHMRSDALAMGGHLAKALGEGYYAVGFLFGSGEFQANVRDDSGRWRFRRYTHSAAPKGSLGALLSRAKKGDYLLDLRGAPNSKPIQTWLRSPHGHRWWGGYNVPEDFNERTSDAENLSQCVPGDAYDGIAFHHRTKAARPINATLILPR